MSKSKVQRNSEGVGFERRLSWVRVTMALVLLAGLGYLGMLGWRHWREEVVVANQKPWFGAYVDVTATPLYAFEQLGSTPTSSVVLSFIVSDPIDACTPTWGSYFSLDEAVEALDLDRRIARLQQQNGRVAVSFGGAINSELALGCQDTEKLSQAYEQVVNRYSVDTIDLDLENEGLADKDAGQRRAQAIAKLQSKRRNEGKSLAVWLTLPVTPQGLTTEGTDAVAQMLISGVDLAGVNVMTMNYSTSKPNDVSMYEAAKSALTETHRQLGVLYKQNGQELLTATLWRKIGATPMIGQNDVKDEVFSTDEARLLNKFAREKGVGRMSMWSANRDVPCGDNYVDIKKVSDSCSGVGAKKLSFSMALGEGIDGDLTQNSKLETVADGEESASKIDDPEKSPYQIWKETGAYLPGTKVVWHGNVYEAKWWTKNDLPDNPVLQAWETPWQLIGPVLPGESPIPQPTLQPGTYPVWNGVDVYDAGQRVLFEGIPFEAKWWNQGESPAASAANADSSAWAPLSQHEVEEILSGF